MRSGFSRAISRRPKISAAIMASGEPRHLGKLTVGCSTSSLHGVMIAGALSAQGGHDEMSEERITRVSLKQARKMKGETDWARVDALTDEDIERAVADDPDQSFWTDEDWANARVVFPQGKA